MSVAVAPAATPLAVPEGEAGGEAAPRALYDNAFGGGAQEVRGVLLPCSLPILALCPLAVCFTA